MLPNDKNYSFHRKESEAHLESNLLSCNANHYQTT